MRVYSMVQPSRSGGGSNMGLGANTDESVQYGAALMIRWREQHGPGGKH